jgi:hypothetical protein
MPSAGASVLANVEIDADGTSVQEFLKNGDFETGDLTYWTLTGLGDVGTALGPIEPFEGQYMAMISSGDGSIGGSSSALEQTFTVPLGATTLTLHYNFVSEEYPEFVGSDFNDVFLATLHTPNGSREIAFEEVNNANFYEVEGIPCGSGDCTWGQTGWLEASIDVAQWAGTDDTLSLTVHDVGDTIYDTIVLLDAIELHSGETGGVQFINDLKGINTLWTSFGLAPADVIKFTGDLADDMRAYEKESWSVLFGLFFGLKYSDLLSSFLKSEDFNDFLENLAISQGDEALAAAALEAAGAPDVIIDIATNLIIFINAFQVHQNIVNSTDDFYIVIPEYPQYQIEQEKLYPNGFIFAVDDFSEESLNSLNLWWDAVYFEFFDEEAINPDGYTLGKANINCITEEYTPVPNNYKHNICYYFFCGKFYSCWQAP